MTEKTPTTSQGKTRTRRGPTARDVTVADVMVKDVVTIDPEAMLTDAAQRMREANVGVLPIVEDGRLKGMITDRDLVVYGIARGVDPAVTPVRYFASEDLVCARPGWTVEDALRVMADNQVGRLPVTDEAGQLLGIVTLSSLALRAPEPTKVLSSARAVARRAARAV